MINSWPFSGGSRCRLGCDSGRRQSVGGKVSVPRQRPGNDKASVPLPLGAAKCLSPGNDKASVPLPLAISITTVFRLVL